MIAPVQRSVAQRRGSAAPPTQQECSLRRLAALAGDDCEAVQRLRPAIEGARYLPPGYELQGDGQRVGAPLIIVSGWAARVKLLPNGKRQVLCFILPGDLVGLCDHRAPVATCSIVSLSEMTVGAAPPADDCGALRRVYASVRALDEAVLLAQIVRLGRLSARERLSDLLLELHDRLEPCGLARDGRFPLPLTQETMADALGLTTVHFNRMLQTVRRAGELEWRGGSAYLPDRAALARKLGRQAGSPAAMN
ncbi:cyclic nucleotide-binding protein [Altererythrobacter sp. B11]|uniref:Crp/Fnr family transcriptional regulator n=1 Tax=Altererythrobacter sp. B11 TaxID=2060312 RepID=UPI000DC71D9E|nr:Crp/Fnr family transcriptional regulator [Altererythrobacter sp. B11]BBC72822.1 cyclic nucleotide-binding protein [Altererythrobacter sp. B11]